MDKYFYRKTLRLNELENEKWKKIGEKLGLNKDSDILREILKIAYEKVCGENADEQRIMNMLEYLVPTVSEIRGAVKAAANSSALPLMLANDLCADLCPSGASYPADTPQLKAAREVQKQECAANRTRAMERKSIERKKNGGGIIV